jgi:hypothetical protein
MENSPQARDKKPLMMCSTSIIFNRLVILIFLVMRQRVGCLHKNACIPGRFPNGRGEIHQFGMDCIHLFTVLC